MPWWGWLLAGVAVGLVIAYFGLAWYFARGIGRAM
jgi:hypothetical protein